MSRVLFPSLPLILFEKRAAQKLAGQCDCDCDCACSIVSEHIFGCAGDAPDDVAMDGNLTTTRIEALKPAQFSTLPLDGEHQLFFGPTCQPTVLNQSASALLVDFQNHQNLSSYLRLVEQTGQAFATETLERFCQAGLLNTTNPILVTKKSETLTAWLHVTDRCNLRCVYCYLPHEPKDMTEITGNEIIQGLFSSAANGNYSKVKIKYAGGEPFLKFSSILTWHKLASELSNQSGIALEEVILSNGTLLTSEQAEIIYKTGLNLMISLDGLGKAHDIHRHYANGSGSFEQTTQAIELAQKVGISPQISVTVSAQNAQALPELVAWLRARNLRFNLNFARENRYYSSEEDQQALTDGMLAAFEVLKNDLPAETLLAGLVDRANLAVPHLHTCAAEKDYLVFNANGQLFRCQMEMPFNPIPVKRQDKLKALQSYVPALNIAVDHKQTCQDCQWRYWCAGGCPLLTQRVNGSSAQPSPYCEVYKKLYPEALKLEGLRLLRNYEKGLSSSPM